MNRVDNNNKNNYNNKVRIIKQKFTKKTLSTVDIKMCMITFNGSAES